METKGFIASQVRKISRKTMIIMIAMTMVNRRYHCGSSEHKMKEDYEARALAKAEAKGPKEVPTLLSICNHSLLKD